MGFYTMTLFIEINYFTGLRILKKETNNLKPWQMRIKHNVETMHREERKSMHCLFPLSMFFTDFRESVIDVGFHFSLLFGSRCGKAGNRQLICCQRLITFIHIFGFKRDWKKTLITFDAKSTKKNPFLIPGHKTLRLSNRQPGRPCPTLKSHEV